MLLCCSLMRETNTLKILVRNCCDEPEIEFQQLNEFDGALKVTIVDNKPDAEFEEKLGYPLVQGEETMMKDQQVKRICGFIVNLMGFLFVFGFDVGKFCRCNSYYFFVLNILFLQRKRAISSIHFLNKCISTHVFKFAFFLLDYLSILEGSGLLIYISRFRV